MRNPRPHMRITDEYFQTFAAAQHTAELSGAPMRDDDTETMQGLVGLTLHSVWLSDDETLLRFDTSAGPFVYETIEECCSTTWFADILNVDALDNARVLAVIPRDLKPYPSDGRSRQEYDILYGLTIRTTNGYCDIIYRNSSNGYYGGSIALVSEPDLEAIWHPISADWTAPHPATEETI